MKAFVKLESDPLYSHKQHFPMLKALFLPTIESRIWRSDKLSSHHKWKFSWTGNEVFGRLSQNVVNKSSDERQSV